MDKGAKKIIKMNIIKNLITIIVPIYNISSYLEKCITSIINQTYKNIQIILVDDGSTDECGDICDRYAFSDNRIKVIHKSNGGLVSARKAGLKEATGEYIGYVDGDDWIEPDLCENMLKEMLDSGADLVDADYYMDMGSEVVSMHSNIFYGRYDVEEIIPIMLCDENFNECCLKAYLWSKMFKRELLEKVQYAVDERITFGEDVAVTYPYVLQCKKISILNYSGYHYVQHLSSMVYTKKVDEQIRNTLLIKGLYNNFIKDVNAGILLQELNQYSKLLFTLRNIFYFDQYSNGRYLLPFGGIEENAKVIIYGAGRVGQSIYRYLSDTQKNQVVDWLDRDFEKYQQLGFEVHLPESIHELELTNIKIIIAINSRKVANSVRKWLIENQVREESIMWLTEEFIDFDLLSTIVKE